MSTSNVATARLLNVGMIDAVPGWHIHHQKHTCHELIIIRRGILHLVIQGRVVTGTPGDVLFYEAGHRHTEDADAKLTPVFHFLVFEWKNACGSPVKIRDARGRLRQIAEWLYHEWRHHGSHAEIVRNTFFHAVLVEWFRLIDNRENALVERTREFVRMHIDEPITLDQLACHSNMSKYHFVRVYKKFTTRTPMADIRLLRITYAQNLLLTTDLPIKAIAPKSGLGDQYHLSRLFRRYLNVTPGEIRGSLKR